MISLRAMRNTLNLYYKTQYCYLEENKKTIILKQICDKSLLKVNL